MNNKLSDRLLQTTKALVATRAKTTPGEFPNCPFIFHQPKRPVRKA